MKNTGIIRKGRASLALALAAGIVCASSSAWAAAASYTWTGNGDDNLWTNPKNWTSTTGTQYPGSSGSSEAAYVSMANVEIVLNATESIGRLTITGDNFKLRGDGAVTLNISTTFEPNSANQAFENITVNYNRTVTSGCAVTLADGRTLTLKNANLALTKATAKFEIQNSAVLVLDDSQLTAYNIYHRAASTSSKARTIVLKGAFSCIASAGDFSGPVGTGTGSTGGGIDFNFVVPKCGYTNASGTVRIPVQANGSNMFQGSSKGGNARFSILPESPALKVKDGLKLTLVKAAGGAARSRTTLTDTENVSFAWVDDEGKAATEDAAAKNLTVDIKGSKKGFMFTVGGSSAKSGEKDEPSEPEEDPTPPEEEPTPPVEDPTPPPSDEPADTPTDTPAQALPAVAGLSSAEQSLYEAAVAKVNEVNPLDPATGKRKYVTFGFITDEHACKRVEGDDAATNPVKDYWYYFGASLTKCDHSIRLLGAVASNLCVDAVFNGGDFSTGNSLKALTNEEYLDNVRYVKGLFAQYLPASIPVFTVDGNHDRAYPANATHQTEGHAMTDAQWREALEAFNSDVTKSPDVDLTMHRDLANPTVGSATPGAYSGNSYHVDCKRLTAQGKPNVRFVCVSEYDTTPGNGSLLRMYDGFQFFDAQGNLLEEGKSATNTLVCVISHGESVTASTLLMAETLYMKASSRKGNSTQQAQLNSNLGLYKGLGFIGSVAGHAHKVVSEKIDADGTTKFGASRVKVSNAYTPIGNTDVKSTYRFSIFTVDTDRNVLVETRLGGSSAPANYETAIDVNS